MYVGMNRVKVNLVERDSSVPHVRGDEPAGRRAYFLRQ